MVLTAGFLAAVECHADHLGDLGAGDVALRLERAVGVTADDVQCSTSIDSLSVLDLGLIRERRPGPYDHDGQHHSHAENQGQNLLQVLLSDFSKVFSEFAPLFPP